MPLRSIPPVTSLQRKKQKEKGHEGLVEPVFKKKPAKKRPKKPRQWRYVSKPYFKRVREPLVDVFKDADEVQVIIDLGGFAKGEVSFSAVGDTYLVKGNHGEVEFQEEIPIPEGTAISDIEESFRNGILELILPIKKGSKKLEAGSRKIKKSKKPRETKRKAKNKNKGKVQKRKSKSPTRKRKAQKRKIRTKVRKRKKK